MSRIGRAPIAIPAGVEIKVEDNNVVTVKGPKGTLTQQFNPNMAIAMEEGALHVTRPNDAKENRALHGLTRTLIHNMVGASPRATRRSWTSMASAIVWPRRATSWS